MVNPDCGFQSFRDPARLRSGGVGRHVADNNTSEFLSSLDDLIEIIADEKGREVRKSAEHPDKTRDMICLDDSENDEDEENQNLNNNSVLLERVTKKTEVHETKIVSLTINLGTVKE